MANTHVVMERKTVSLPVELTDAEMLERGKEAATVLAERDALELKAKDVAATHKTEIKALENRLRALGGIIRSGTEDRPVDCEYIADTQSRKMSQVRCDSGATVYSRPLTSLELENALQMPLLPDEAASRARN